MSSQRFLLRAAVRGALADLTRACAGLVVEALPVGRRLLLTCRGPYPGDAVLATHLGVREDSLRSMGSDGTRTVLLSALGPVDDLLAAAEGTSALILPPLVWTAGDVRLTLLAPDVEAVEHVAAFLGGAVIESRRNDAGPTRRRRSRGDGLLDQLTAGQARALSTAVEQGYYESPRRVTTAEVAKVLAVSRSTFEEHLRAAESQVVRAMAPLVRLKSQKDSPSGAALETYAKFSQELGLYVHLTLREGRVAAVHLAEKKRGGAARDHPYLARILQQIVDGSDDLRDVPLHLNLGPFERKVVEALRDIPRGQVLTYGELARRLGHPGAARAVGNALAKNPVPLLLPCHRVVPASGGVGNYSGGGGGATKRRLLEQEGALEPEPDPPKASET